MKVGDLVKLRPSALKQLYGKDHDITLVDRFCTGVIIDMIEDDNGFYDVKVLFSREVGWFSDVQVEVISHARF